MCPKISPLRIRTAQYGCLAAKRYSTFKPSFFTSPPHYLFISADVGGIGLGRPWQGFRAVCCKTALYIFAGKRRVEFLVQPRNDSGRRPGWRGKHIPQHGFKARHAAFGERRQIRKQARSCRTGDRKSAQGSGFYIADRDGDREKHHRNMPTKEIAHGGAVSLVRHVLQLHASFIGEVLAGQMIHCPNARRTVLRRSGCRFRIRD